MPRLAANLSTMFREHAFPDRFAAAAAAGFDAVECQYPYDHPADLLAERMAAAGQQMVLINFPPGDREAGDRGLAIFPDRAAEFTASVAQGLAYARALGVPRLHLLAGRAAADDAGARARFLDALAEAADAAGAEGREVLVEPLSHASAAPYLVDDFNRAAEIVTACGRPNVRLQFDIFHRQVLHGDVLRGLRDLWPLIGHIQIAAVPDHHEPGSGELDDFRILAEIDRLGYAGHVGCEYIPAGRTEDGLSWRDRLTA